MPKDNDSILNDILKDTENNQNENPESGAEKEENFIENSFKASEFKLRSAETVGDFEEDSESQEIADENISDDSSESDEQPPKNPSEKKKKKKRKKHHYRLPGVLILTTLIFAVAISLSLVIIAYGKDMLGIGKSENTQLIVIPEGATTEEISLMLEQDGIIKSPEFFQLFSRLSKADDEYIAGEHFVRPNMAYETIIEELTSIQSEEKVEVSVTFPEGITLYDAAVKLEGAKVCSASDFIFYFNSGGYGFDFENKLSSSTTLKFYRMEGYLFPDTYRFYVNSDPESVCMKIYQNFENKITDKYYQQMQKKGMTLDEVITLASIVQAEAPTAESMKKVASVFENRLANSDDFPMLQSDPTTYYVEEIIKPNIQVPSNAIFEAYDTYKGHGLPPGAIGNPGIDAIEAVLYPADTDYYYFCADIDTKEIFYAETIDEHEENLAAINGETADDDENTDDEDYYYE